MSTFDAQATVWDLATDFSTTSNPNGVWSYTEGGNPIAPIAGGWGNYSTYDGSILKLDDSWVGTHDTQAGDVVVHSLSIPYGGASTFVGVTFTSPLTGLYNISGQAWDAEFSGRNANWTLSVNGQLVAEYTNGVYGLYRNDAAAQFSNNVLAGKSLNGVNLAAGEQITFLTQTTTYYGYFMGVNLTVAAVPEPEEWAMMLLGFGLVGFQVKRKQRLISRS